jgi:hypothetical protein
MIDLRQPGANLVQRAQERRGRRVHRQRQRLATVEIQVDPGSVELPGEEMLVDVLCRMLGPGWEVKGWKAIPGRIDELGQHFYRLEFVFVPDSRTDEEHRADAVARGDGADGAPGGPSGRAAS